MAHIEHILTFMTSQTGDPYIFGSEASRADRNPDAFDCSELVEWACNRGQVSPRMPDGSKNQKAHCENNGTLIPVEQAIGTRGALLFRMTGSPTHVVASLGNELTIEARGSAYGVGEFRVRERGWTHGALIPGVDYQSAPPTVDPHVPRIVKRTLVPGRIAGPDGRFPLWKVLADGSVHALHGAPFHGALPAGPGGLNIQVDNVVDILPNGDGGYWLAAADGAVFAFGQAVFWGSLPGIKVRPTAPVTRIERRPDGREGYVLIAEDEGTFAFPLATSTRG